MGAGRVCCETWTSPSEASGAVARRLCLPPGKLTWRLADDFRVVLEDAVNSDAQGLLVDLTDVGFLDSTGIGVLAGALRTRGDRKVGIVVPPGPVEKVLLLTGIDRVLPLFGSLEAALSESAAKPDSDQSSESLE